MKSLHTPLRWLDYIPDSLFLSVEARQVCWKSESTARVNPTLISTCSPSSRELMWRRPIECTDFDFFSEETADNFGAHCQHCYWCALASTGNQLGNAVDRTGDRASSWISQTSKNQSSKASLLGKTTSYRVLWRNGAWTSSERWKDLTSRGPTRHVTMELIRTPWPYTSTQTPQFPDRTSSLHAIQICGCPLP